MRIRSIKPDFWTSEDIAALPWSTRLLFIGLWSYVDDNGVGRDNEKLIESSLFPLEDDPRETLATVSRGLRELSEANLITRYTVDGRAFIYINTWASHQRIDKPNKPRYEPPTCENAVVATPSRDSRETPAPGTEEQGNRGAGEQASLSVAIATTESRDDVTRICNHLATRIENNGSKRPTITAKWRDAARLMLDRDGHPEDQIHAVIIWCQEDEFWRSNILSLPKLREKYDQLRMKAQQAHVQRNRPGADTEGIFERAAKRMGVTA